MSKTLGQVAYEAHYETLVPSPEVVRNAFWKTAEPLVRDAWQAAAEAVIHETQLERLRQIGAREIAVIEAARAVLHSENWNQQDMVDDLNEATEAYEALDSEEGVMSKTLGQIAYEAYFRERFGANTKQWWETEEAVTAWQAAAEAVARRAWLEGLWAGARAQEDVNDDPDDVPNPYLKALDTPEQEESDG